MDPTLVHGHTFVIAGVNPDTASDFLGAGSVTIELQATSTAFDHCITGCAEVDSIPDRQSRIEWGEIPIDP